MLPAPMLPSVDSHSSSAYLLSYSLRMFLFYFSPCARAKILAVFIPGPLVISNIPYCLAVCVEMSQVELNLLLSAHPHPQFSKTDFWMYTQLNLLG